jgi:hypothetical protein
MTRTEADRFIIDYKVLLKAWVMASTGFSRTNEAELRFQLDAGIAVLTEIILEFPDLAAQAKTLINARRSSTGPETR